MGKQRAEPIDANLAMLMIPWPGTSALKERQLKIALFKRGKSERSCSTRNKLTRSEASDKSIEARF